TGKVSLHGRPSRLSENITYEKDAHVLLGVVDDARLPDYHDLDLPGILKHFLDLVDNVTRHPMRPDVVHGIRVHENSHFATRLDGVALFDALKRIGDVLQRLETFHV